MVGEDIVMGNVTFRIHIFNCFIVPCSFGFTLCLTELYHRDGRPPGCVTKTQVRQIELMICDAGGSSMFDSLRQLSYNDGDVIVICYSITDRDSLQNVSERWRPEMLSHVTSDRPIVLVATKKDLRDSDHSFSSVRGSDKLHQEPVTTLEGQEMREKLDAVDFIECSAKQDDGVRELFQRVAEVGLESSRSRRKKFCRQS
ncbi:rho-related GTP-binding protein RhoC-like [Haliotis rufescens]|uniref:rho-related GTP-binding protein RhoC-like n=1 Tax=Haliotis rufescens TaxID=6454 RepID=UPI00201E925F|nr:rho-related GTP-binding protein RhoC-like [Haliotis rufescens]